jgi:L-alanine-DL-glutamate epimerase-like enolase superfamily enzyme
MKIKHVETLTLDIPFYARRVTRAMQRAQTHSERMQVCRIETDNGIVGYGDGSGGAEALKGRNPYALLNDSSLGMGAHIAVLDVVGQDAGVPVHALLGTQVRKRCPISWWDIDMPPQDWAAEARESLKRGYTSFKMKARPWRDIVQQIETVGKVVPHDYKFDVDFNGFLLNQPRAEIILQQLDEHPNVGMYESPFYLSKDLEGARILRERVRKPIVEHFREELVHADCCDGFVCGGGPDARRQDALASSFNKPFWLQIVGTGITAAYAMHLGAVLSHAQLPYITCHELWKHDLLKKRLEVENGYMAVPEGPGLGIEVDEKALKRYRVDPGGPSPTDRYRQNKRILRINWPGVDKKKRIWDFTNEAAYQTEFYQGNIPGFERGVDLEVIEDDGSAGFKRQHAKLVAQGI